jgi:hypothetical protein
MSAIAWAYIAGAAIELAGLGLVAWDVLEASRTLREMSDPLYPRKLLERRETRTLFEMMAATAAGNLWRRGTGVALIACGLIVQTVANVWAL